MKSGFLDKLIERLDRLDSKSLQSHFLRLAHERGLLEAIFQSIQEGIVVIGPFGQINYANRAAERLLGFSAADARGRPISRYLEDIDWDRVLALEATEWSKLITREIEVTYPEHRFVSFYVVPLPATEEEEKGAVVILRDISHERAREASTLESERLNAVKLLAAGVAHEIGNPLNALNIHLQLLEREIRGLREEGGRPAEKEEHWDERMSDLAGLVDVARKEVSRLDLILTQFLRAIRPTKPKLVWAQVGAILQETLTLLRQEIENRRIKVEINYSRQPPKVRIDRNQIKQAFFNVIKNAIQAMPDGGSLTVTVSASDYEVDISFQDTGGGIASEDLGRIFEPYQTTKEGGSGLGLMIVQRIVQEHGGQIEITSKPGVGTVFTISLPLAERRIRLLKAPAEKAAGLSS